MTTSSANLMENPLKAHKSKSYHKANGMYFAFLFSIVIYISVFYIFSPFPPSTDLFSNSKFWFVISNTLILIIAADYGAFASSKDQRRDTYDEYVLRSRARRSFTAVPSFVSQYPEIMQNSSPEDEEILKEKNEEDVADEKNNEIPERILEIVKIEPETDNNVRGKSQQQHPMKADNEACDQVITEKKIEPKTIRQSKSDKVNRVTIQEKKNNLLRSKTEKHESIAKENEFPSEDQNEFSTMTDEELNRRVEEFIQKFNMQIRLQGA